MKQPSLATARLHLTPFVAEDAEALQQAINYPEIARMTRSIEYPYSLEMARAWIANHEELWRSGKAVVFAIRGGESRELWGAVGLEICCIDHAAELGYWVTVPKWGQGIATEAANRVVEFGFADLGLNRISAHHMLRNPASGRVLEKLGMVREGVLRKLARKWGEFHDVAVFGILAEDWERLLKM